VQSENHDPCVHHLIPRKLFKQWNKPLEHSNVLRNLISLCRSCHMIVEHNDNIDSPVPDSHWRAE
jgi:5-methylcytosine-specific restriction endonuclease McrA